MITVQFSNKRDCDHLYRCIHKHLLHVSGIRVIRGKGDRLLISSEEDLSVFRSVAQPLLAQVFTAYIIAAYEKKWILECLETKFYYSDPEEKNAIVSITCAIMDGQKPELPQVDQLPSRDELIETAILSLLREKGNHFVFNFDSFLKFRLKAYRECLTSYVEMAIDEYKFEQDYQSFVNHLRAFVNRKKPVVKNVHILYDQKPVFYDGDLCLIHDEKIAKAIKASGFLSVNTIIESSLLQPLLALAPSRVFCYTLSDESGLFYTLKNIFQERLTFHSLEEFPFFRDSYTRRT